MNEYTHKGLFAYCIPVYIKFDRYNIPELKGRNYICDKLLDGFLYIWERFIYCEFPIVITGELK